MSATTKKMRIACADMDYIDRAGGAAIGFGSVDLDDRQARELLLDVEARYRSYGYGWPDGIVSPPPYPRFAVREIVARLEGRYFAGAAMPPSDGHPASLLAMLEQQKDAWGRRHRLIEVTCNDDPVMRTSDGRHRGDIAVHRCWSRHDHGRWHGWRLAAPIAFEEAQEHSALRLAQIVAFVAANVAAERATGAYGYLETDFDRSLERHYVGLMDLYPHHADAIGSSNYWGAYTSSMNRQNLWEEEVETDRLTIQHLRLAASIGGSALEDCRDRLLLKMLGRGVTPPAALGLRIAGLDVDGEENLHDTSGGPGWRIPLLQLDDCDGVGDFWTLVRASESLDGFLFADVDGEKPYGRKPLGPNDLARVVEDRSAAPGFVAKTNGLAAARRNPGDASG